MQKSSSFTIYNASAGSGKTYTLVKEYLKLILRFKTEDYYKNLLAITFTNKAVGEMKQRIIDNLVSFSTLDVVVDPPEMLCVISEETQIDIDELHAKSKKILKHLLHHYSGFTIETIDRFNHQLIRTFARDLKLPQNFEVTLEAPELLIEAVDNLILKAGSDQEITKLLIDFALEKTDDDSSWDISKDIVQTAQLLLNEIDAPHLDKLKHKTLRDFTNFKRQLLLRKKELLKEIKPLSAETLELIDESGLQYTDFSSSYLPKHFENLCRGNTNINFNAKWQEALAQKELYPKRVPTSIACIIDELTPVFVSNFELTKKLVFNLKLIDSIIKNLTPLSVINLVRQELNALKEERGLLLISEFNALINQEIKNQPVPFIYERLGEKYQHFFIDEFQDTSLLQWQNLIPLVDNALSQEKIDGTRGSLLLVGDAKQSIYRWRGGLPEQFINLYDSDNPFSIAPSQKNVLNLETNYRSYSQIVTFNNNFFSFVANHFGNVTHSALYEHGNKQNSTPKEGGYVKIEFIDAENKSDSHEPYGMKVYEAIMSLNKNKYAFKEICILTRTKKEGISLGSYLIDQGIPIISSETLLLDKSTYVQCIVNALSLSILPGDQKTKMILLDFLYDHFNISIEKHSFLNGFLNLSPEEFDVGLKKFDIDFSFKELEAISLYDSCEYCIRKFQLNRKADGYLFSFMDLVFEFQQQPQAGKVGFLDYWESKKESASIAASEQTNAVQIMTIHKSKGLEFPAVIFPYADVDIYSERNAKAWFPWASELDAFDEVYINFNKEVASFGEAGESLFKKRRETLELDAINLLYVTLTRAIEQLYIFATTPKENKDGPPKTFNQFFGAFLVEKERWNPNSKIYDFGTFRRENKTILQNNMKQISPPFIASPSEDHNLRIISTDSLLWDTQSEVAMAIGNLLHDTMALIKNKADVISVFEEMEMRAIVPKKEIKILNKTVDQIVNHPELTHLFNNFKEVINEREIITKDGEIVRPDRLNIYEDDSICIVDYKTGAPIEAHANQINRYARALEEMKFNITEKLLVYASDDKIVVNKV